MVVIYPYCMKCEYRRIYVVHETNEHTDISIFVVGDDSIRKALVDREVLLVRGGFIERLCLWCIRNDIV